ncbi:MAG: hypothetical protein EOO85_09195 [Pedobacter sp.]|nr:MAG: hypothetical protein EOO85_09195 [Pedobacter sp.]
MSNDLNKERPMIMHIDLNSAFATTEQQAHPSLRGKPIGVTNRISKECCVIAASYEAKALGVKVGTRRSEALAICPDFIMLETDPPKYNKVYEKLVTIMQDYSPKIKMKSIDEGVIDFHGMEPVLKGRSLTDIGYEIKQRVKDDIGDWMRINVGIAPNRFLAKEAAGWHKPDGLDLIDHNNIKEYYADRPLTGLSGIAERNQARLNAFGIYTPLDFLNCEEYALKKQIFRSITGTYWYLRLRGHEIDDYETKKGVVGRQWVVAEPTKDPAKLRSYLSFLCETTGTKLRFLNMEARGIIVWATLMSGETFYSRKMYKSKYYTDKDILRHAMELFNEKHPNDIVRTLGVTCYQLTPSNRNQISLFEDMNKEEWMTKAVDEINDFYGMFTIFKAVTLDGKKVIKQKIPFGGTEYFDLLLKTK